MDSRTLKRDLARDSNGIHRASKAYQKHFSRDPKGVRGNLTAFQWDFAEDPMESYGFQGISKGHSLQ